MDIKEIGKRIRNYRVSRGLTQAELGWNSFAFHCKSMGWLVWLWPTYLSPNPLVNQLARIHSSHVNGTSIHIIIDQKVT